MTDIPITAADIRDRVREVVAVAQGRKAVELKVLHLEPVTDFTDYFVICSGTNSRQVQAIAEAVRDQLRDSKVRPLHIEGLEHGSWVLLDFGDFIAHIFDEETRKYYGLERIWADAPDVTSDLT